MWRFTNRTHTGPWTMQSLLKRAIEDGDINELRRHIEGVPFTGEDNVEPCGLKAMEVDAGNVFEKFGMKIRGKGNTTYNHSASVPIDYICDDHLGTTLLLYACKVKKDKVATFLIIAGADVTLADKDGMTTLMYAASYGCTTLIDFMIEHAIHHGTLDIQNNAGETALFIAAKTFPYTSFLKLLACGADASIYTYGENVPRQRQPTLAFFSQMPRRRRRHIYPAMVNFYCHHLQNDVEASMDEYTRSFKSLYCVGVEEGKEEEAERQGRQSRIFCRALGALFDPSFGDICPNAAYEDEPNVMYLALCTNKLGLVSFFHERGLVLDMHNLVNDDIMYEIINMKERTDVMQYLLAHELPPSTILPSGCSLLRHAIDTRDDEIVRCLINAGASLDDVLTPEGRILAPTEPIYELIRKAQCWYVMPEWRPQYHRDFPMVFRVRLRTLVIIAKACEHVKGVNGRVHLVFNHTAACLHMLPEELLQELYAFIQAPPNRLNL